MFTTILIFLFVLGLLVLVHEAGHLLAAKRAGVRVDEFAIGFPPKLFSFKRGGTRYALNLIPLGGYVKIKGEQGDHAEDLDSFSAKSPLQRAWILSAGVLMNIALAAVLLTVGFTVGLPQALPDGETPSGGTVASRQVQIVEVVENLPAQKQGIQLGDVVLSIDDTSVKTYQELQGVLDDKLGESVIVKVQRGDELIAYDIVPEILESTGQPGLGVGLIESGTVRYSFPLAVVHGVASTGRLIQAIVVAFYEIIRDLIIGVPVDIEIAGPVGIANLTGIVSRLGFVYILQFTALLSVNLAVINYLPFPALDGGRVLFLLIEKARRKKMNPKVEAATHNIGFAVLLFLIFLVTIRDVSRISEGFSGFISRISGG